MSISRTISGYNNPGSSKRSSNKKTTVTPGIIWKLKARIERNMGESCTKINCRTEYTNFVHMQRILQKEPSAKPRKIQKVHDVTAQQKKIQKEKAKKLLRLHENGKLLNNILFGSMSTNKMTEFTSVIYTFE